MTKKKRNALDMPRSIYAIRCKANGKMYIGSAVDVKQRWLNHLSSLRTGEKGRRTSEQNKNWQADYDKYGVSGFEIYILEENIKYSDSYSRESYYIDYYDVCNPEKGYNATGSKAWHKANIGVIKGLPPKK
ncbi:MAG: GIY-YIG nuclease family protein [Clostridia bacterium]|nr:GIY-YIG nuclease family protein [Clostridia bacterium]